MTGCQSCDELLMQYLLALQELKSARQQLAYSSSLRDWETLRARLASIEAYKEHARRELYQHCEVTGCEPPELAGRLQEPSTMIH